MKTYFAKFSKVKTDRIYGFAQLLATSFDSSIPGMNQFVNRFIKESKEAHFLKDTSQLNEMDITYMKKSIEKHEELYRLFNSYLLVKSFL